MQHGSRRYFSLLIVLVVLAFSMLNVNSVFARTNTGATHAAIRANPGIPTVAHMIAHHVVNMRDIPAKTGNQRSRTSLPSPTGIDAKVFEHLVEAAAYRQNAPLVHTSLSHPGISGNSAKKQTPTVSTGFQGQSENGSQPPDHALAASPQWVLQGVNSFFAVYDTSGNLQSGWPKAMPDFFGIPSPGSCSPTPFTSDPRAFYDASDQHFWAADLEVEGVNNSCSLTSRYWIAVSQTNDPTGSWNIYSFDMSQGTNNWADFTQFGFDQQAIYFSGNMYDLGGSFQYAKVFGASKSAMESGSSVTAYGFYNLMADNVAVDTVQPVEALNGKSPSGLFANSFDINSGGGACANGCSGIVVWTITNPGTPGNTMTGLIVPTSNYMLAPRADQPGCTQCVPQNNPPLTNFTGTPIFQNNLISFGLVTDVNNGTQDVPGAFWGQISPSFNSNGSISSATIFQSGYFNYSGDGAITYPAMMPDASGNLFMVFEFMNSSFNPGVAYVARRGNDPSGRFPDGGIFLKQGNDPTIDTRWGDYEAASFDGSGTNNVWLAGEYSATGGTWSTYIGKDHF